MNDTELIEELMDRIETRSLSPLLKAVAERCKSDRYLLIREGHFGSDAITYLSDEQNLLEASSTLFEQIEQNTTHKERQ